MSKSSELDSTIRILKAFYKMGDLRSMDRYARAWNLVEHSMASPQEVEARTLTDLVDEMAAFEAQNGPGSCLQLEHNTVGKLMKENFYPRDFIQNARSSGWQPTAYPGWGYPGLRLTNSSTSPNEP